MNYQKVYDALVQKNHNFSEGEYFETHHKLPKALGGTNDKSNLVNLTAREHYIAHLLLVKITEKSGNKTAYCKMLYAFNCMKWGRIDGRRSFRFNSRLYQLNKEKYAIIRSEMMKTKNNPIIGKMWIHSDELKMAKIWDKDKPIPEGWLKGRKLRDPEKERLKEKLKEERNLQQIQEYDKKVKLLTSMYNDYIEFGISYVRRKYSYSKSEENLTIAFKRHVPEYDANALKKASRKRYCKKHLHLSQEERVKYFSDMYAFFQEHGYEETVKKFKWCGTRNTLRWNFRKYATLHLGMNVV